MGNILRTSLSVSEELGFTVEDEQQISKWFAVSKTNGAKCSLKILRGGLTVAGL